MATQLTSQTRKTSPDQAITTQHTSDTPKGVFTRQIASILLMAIGIGWTGGNFVPSDMPNGVTAINEAIHFLPALLLLLFAVRLFHASVEHVPARGAVVGITVLAAILIIGCIVMVAMGYINPDPSSVGVHNLNDWVPAILMSAGSLVWLSTLIFKGHGR